MINEDKNKFEVKAIDKISGNFGERQKKELLEKTENLLSREMQDLPKILGGSKVNKYMITNNLNIEDGLVNRAIGTLEEYTILVKNSLFLWI